MTKGLIKDLEAATEGSAELDAEVAFAFGWRHSMHDDMDDANEAYDLAPSELVDCAGVWRHADTPPHTFETDRDPRYRNSYYSDPPRYTRSLDDAVHALEGVSSFESQRPIEGGYEIAASLRSGKAVIGVAKTRPLAICIAALKAKEASDGS